MQCILSCFSGPFAHLFHGVHEQTFIYYVMTYSACLDQFENEPHCKETNNGNNGVALTVSTLIVSIALLMNAIFH